MSITCRDLHDLADLQRVVDLEREVWQASDDELVPASLLVASVKCGAILVGAFDGPRLVGFAYAFPGERHGRRLQWSHMLGVHPAYRGAGVGRALKLLQRERALLQGIDLMEWTYDPLQAANAHFNFTRLGVVVREYLEDVYGETNSPLHRGAPTDRFVAQWWLRDGRVRRLAGEVRGGSDADGGHDDTASGADAPANGDAPAGLTAVRTENVPLVNPPQRAGSWWVCDERPAVPLAAPALRVAVPGEFTAMLSEAPALARQWRMATRHVFEEAFGAGFVAVAFQADSDTGGGQYVLRKP